MKALRKGDLQTDLRTAHSEETVALWGIDPLLGEREIVWELRGALGLGDNVPVVASEPRLAGVATWYTLVRVPPSVAATLLALRALRIGAYMCRPDRWVRVMTCFNCHRPGHKSADCPAPKGGKRCHRCASTEHLAGACKAAQEYCLVCEIAGHRADAVRCPKYKEALTKKRTARKSKRSPRVGNSNDWVQVGGGNK